MTTFAGVRSDRIDTSVEKVAVRRGEGSSHAAAAYHIKKKYPGVVVIAVWSTKTRNQKGDPVFEVEFDLPDAVE